MSVKRAFWPVTERGRGRGEIEGIQRERERERERENKSGKRKKDRRSIHIYSYQLLYHSSDMRDLKISVFVYLLVFFPLAYILTVSDGIKQFISVSLILPPC